MAAPAVLVTVIVVAAAEFVVAVSAEVFVQPGVLAAH